GVVRPCLWMRRSWCVRPGVRRWRTPPGIRNSSRPGDVVLDPLGGSGTTLIAAEKSGRRARLIELEPAYCDVIVRRWQDYTGKQAARADGVAFEEASSSR
ncbi:MAG: site-specific DNA-methyltransferase, partial [Rhodocyclaceae bacterium]|nr:site-specific DNA-methyltransferase [Rhodocyclaceae bacterium]